MLTPEKNKKASELSDDELGSVSGGVESLRGGREEKPGEVPEDELDGVSGGTETNEEQDDEDNESGDSRFLLN